MFINELMLLYICASLHFRAFECVLVIKPQNLAVVSGECITLHCASDVSASNILWSIKDPGSSVSYMIYTQNILASSVSSYITVSDREDGNCSLNINASLTAAKRYICTEVDSGLEASAELIVMKSGLQCKSTNGYVHMSCSTVSAGSWAPEVTCCQWKPGVGLAVLPGNDTVAVDNNVITRTWNYTNKNEWFHIFCETAFKESGRPKEASATNIPKYFLQTLAYNGTRVSYSGTISNNRSAECPAGTTACPVAAATKCPECPTRATACPVATVANCPECPARATACPVATATKCPECPARATACPVATASKCPECPTRATACPVATAAKCPECPARATACPVTAATKCPDCPARATACPVVTTAKCPECPEGATSSNVTAATEDPASAATEDRVTISAVQGRVLSATEDCVASAAEDPAAAAAEDHAAAAAEDRVAIAAVQGRMLSADEDCMAAAADGPVGPGWIASVVLNCMLVPALIGLTFAV